MSTRSKKWCRLSSQDFAIEEFRSSLNSATSPDQFKEVFSHGVSSSIMSPIAIYRQLSASRTRRVKMAGVPTGHNSQLISS